MTPNAITDASRTHLRPNRSAVGPATNAPKAKPTSAALRTGPRASLETSHSLVSAGATKPIAAVSKPSAATIRKHRIRIPHWNGENPCESMNCCTSITSFLSTAIVRSSMLGARGSEQGRACAMLVGTAMPPRIPGIEAGWGAGRMCGESGEVLRRRSGG